MFFGVCFCVAPFLPSSDSSFLLFLLFLFLQDVFELFEFLLMLSLFLEELLLFFPLLLPLLLLTQRFLLNELILFLDYFVLFAGNLAFDLTNFCFYLKHLFFSLFFVIISHFRVFGSLLSLIRIGQLLPFVLFRFGVFILMVVHVRAKVYKIF